MRDFGLLDFWAKWYQPDVRQCLEKADNIMQLKKSSKKDSTRLSLKNLTGAFVILIVGYLVSFVAFLAEKILRCRKQ
jgi:ionotropic glutamate receptor